MLSIAKERIILADSSKFQKVARCQIAPISMADKIITDNGLSQQNYELASKHDVLIERV